MPFERPLRDLGLLLLRLGLGLSFILIHGAPKMFGGVDRWERVGGAMGRLGIDFAPAFWGFMASFAEFFGGFFLLFGLLFRPATALLAFTMFLATVRHIADGDSLGTISHPLELGIVFVALFLIGPGRYAVDSYLRRRR
jgi:putative oxidoreductase